jgi:50S ribosomal subunit-associated GTPase HflX
MADEANAAARIDIRTSSFITLLLSAEGDCMILDRLKILLAILNVQAEAAATVLPTSRIARLSIELPRGSARGGSGNPLPPRM